MLVDGAFYDFTAQHFTGTHAAAPAGTLQLAAASGFNSGAEQFVRGTAVLDRIYGR